MLIRLVVRAPFLVIGAAVMAVMLDWRLSLIFFIAGPLVALVLYLVMSRSVPFFKIIQRKLDRLSLITRENLSGVRVIRAFSRQEQEKKRFHEANTDQMETAISVGRISALLNPLTSAIVNLAIVAVVWFGGVRVQAGGMTQGEIIAFVNYLNQILVAMIVVANLVVIFTKAFASAARVNEVLEMHSSIVNKTNQPVQPVQDSPKICFEQVRFCYPEAGADALSDINLTIRRGQTVGIIGGTGCGKSTLVNLIPRFYEVSSGSIRVDGTDVRSYPIPQLRKKIGMVPQRAVLFSGTLRENMQWNKQDAGDEEIWQALRVAQAEGICAQAAGRAGHPHFAGRRKPFRRTEAAADDCQSAGRLAGDSGAGRQCQRTGLCHRCCAAARDCRFGPGDDGADCFPACKHSALRRPDCCTGRRKSGGHRHPRAAAGKLRRISGNLLVAE